MNELLKSQCDVGMGLKTEIIEVDPAYAEKLLASGAANRKLKRRKIEQFRRDIEAGRWRVGPPIFIDKDRRLIDGQNRLEAVIKAGVVVPFLFILGVPSDTQLSIDTGTARTMADVLTIQGVPHSHALAAALKWIAAYDAGLSLSAVSYLPSHDALLELLSSEGQANLEASVRIAKGVTTSGLRIGPGTLSGVVHRCRTTDLEEAEVFYDRLRSGRGLKDDDALSAIRDLLIRENLVRGDRRRDSVEQGALMIKAFNFWRRGVPTKSLRWRRGGSKPEPFPLIEQRTE